jgi:hypothetical protein
MRDVRILCFFRLNGSQLGEEIGNLANKRDSRQLVPCLPLLASAFCEFFLSAGHIAQTGDLPTNRLHSVVQRGLHRRLSRSSSFDLWAYGRTNCDNCHFVQARPFELQKTHLRSCFGFERRRFEHAEFSRAHEVARSNYPAREATQGQHYVRRDN